MNYQLLGENIQIIRKHRKMKQQELADAIGINLQSLSKIERGVNYPTFETLEKIMNVLGVTPNELLTGEWEQTSHMEQFIMEVVKREEDFNVSLDSLPDHEYFQSQEEWQFYMKAKLSEYIQNYMNDTKTSVEELCEIKKLVQRQKIERLMKCYDVLHSKERYGEPLKGYPYVEPYDDATLADLADENNNRNIPEVSPKDDFDSYDYNEYLKELNHRK